MLNPVRPTLCRSDEHGLSVTVDGETSAEIVAALYRRFGLAFAEHLRGSYAVAISDPDQRRLILSRDAVGIRPLYYAATDTEVLFASDIQSLHDQLDHRPQIHLP